MIKKVIMAIMLSGCLTPREMTMFSKSTPSYHCEDQRTNDYLSCADTKKESLQLCQYRYDYDLAELQISFNAEIQSCQAAFQFDINTVRNCVAGAMDLYSSSLFVVTQEFERCKEPVVSAFRRCLDTLEERYVQCTKH